MLKSIQSFNDRTDLVWGVSCQSSGTAGSFLKSFEVIDGKKFYYKASNYDSVRGFIGHESLNEIVACNLAEMLGISHLLYELVTAKINVRDKVEEATFTKSQDFKRAGEHKMTFETFYELHKFNGEELMSFVQRMGLSAYVYDMFLLDWIICNRDRHGANIEVLVNNKGFRMAPLFDHGLSFAFSCYDFRDIETFDYMKDGPVNNFIGSCVLSDNIKTVPKTVRDKVDDIDYSRLFDGVYGAPQKYYDAIERMVKMRVDYVKKI